MANARLCVIGRGVASGLVAWLVTGLTLVMAADPVALREVVKPGDSTKVTSVFKAQGLYRPASPPGASKDDEPKPLSLKVETKLEYLDRILHLADRTRPLRAARRVTIAGAAVNGEIRPQAATLRSAVALLVAEPTADGVVVYSPLGPLTRSELELVQGPADSLELGQLLPDKPVAQGDRWKLGDAPARALSDYDTVSSNTLEATLASLDDAEAIVRLRGEVRGSVLGGEGTIAITGSYTFDRKAQRVAKLSLERAETRRAGPVEAGLDVKSTLTVTREPTEAPAILSNATLAQFHLDQPDPARLRLRLAPPGGKYTLVHDRDWHIYWDDNRLTVLKRLENGEVVAQCNLAAGPDAGKGRHQDLTQFRDEIKRTLGDRFVRYLGVGEVEGETAGHFRYKVGVQGKQGDLGVVWYYYLIASPAGEQVVATFTLADKHAKAFGSEDERLIGSFRWEPPGPAAEAASKTP